MPYRVDLRTTRGDAFDRLVELGAIDAERSGADAIAALMPDSVAPERIAGALGVDDVAVSPAVGRDEGSVWVLSRRPIRVGRIHIVPAHADADPAALKLIDAAAFGTGLHPTTALCLEMLQDAVDVAMPESVLDLGTGSGVLALAALRLGVPRAVGIDIDDEALRAAADNARINGVDGRLELLCGGPATLEGTWPLILANVLAAPLIEMAPELVRRIGHRGRVLLSGIPSSVEHEVDGAYRRLGMRRVRATSRGGWVALEMEASW